MSESRKFKREKTIKTQSEIFKDIMEHIKGDINRFE